MPIKFSYNDPLLIHTYGAEINPVVTINTDLAIIQGSFIEKSRRVDTGEEIDFTDRPIQFTIQLTAGDLQAILQIAMQRAIEQNVLRMSTPTLPGTLPNPVNVVVRIIPASATVIPGGTMQFEAIVTGTETIAVVWSATGGEISETGLYTAPLEPGAYTVTATSVASSEAIATASVIVQ
jgi:hypothetical protein